MSELPYYNPELSRMNEVSAVDSYAEVRGLLTDPQLQDEISAGNVTLAMVRPNVGPDANLLGLPDIEAAEKIEEMIEGLGVMAKFSFQFSKKTTEEFYGGGPQESMQMEQPRDPTKYDNRWQEFIDFMTSGPTTVLLLYSNDGDAIPKWRAHLGHWNIDQVRDEATIRGKLGVNKYNNLVHGSDSSESVLREIKLINDCLKSEE